MSPAAVDVHQHLWPEPFLAALSARRTPPCLRGSTLRLAGLPDARIDLRAHTVEGRLRLLDAAGTDVALVSLQPTLGIDGLAEPERRELLDAFEEGAGELERASGGRLVPLSYGVLRPGCPGAVVAADAFAAGACDTLLAELEAAGRFAFVHPAGARPPDGAPAWWPEIVDYAAQMQAAYVAWVSRLADTFPRLRVVFAILAGGAPMQHERLRSRGVDWRPVDRDGVFLETASYGRRALELCLSTFGVGRLLHGSDTPVIDAEPTLRALFAFGNAVSDVVRRENPWLLLESTR